MPGVAERFQAACVDVAEPELAAIELLPVLLSRACARVFEVAGAGISVFADDYRVPLGASDRDANTAERLQFTLGEGPCLDAHHHARPFRGDGQTILRKWPAFYGELVSRTPYRSIISLPLRLTPNIGGAVDLYQRRTDDVDAPSLADMTVVADRIADALSWAAPSRAAGIPGPGWLHGPTAQRRTRAWIAIGMLNYKLDLSANDALARLRAYAYAHDQVIDDVAASLVQRTLSVEQLEL